VRNPLNALTGKEYFLGAAVQVVDDGAYHLLLDGQQRLAVSTILLAALRDKFKGEFKSDAANQLQASTTHFDPPKTFAYPRA
jgi:uncharacterized protein with ParB-like and HNH nuclease domain